MTTFEQSLIRDWDSWDDSRKSEYVATWSKEHERRRPRYNLSHSHGRSWEKYYSTNLPAMNQKEMIPEYLMAHWINSIKQEGSSRYLKSDFDAMKDLNWWTSLTLPKVQTQHVTNCDMCNQSFYSETRCNKRKNGYPAFLLCQYCYDWSMPRAKKGMACVIKGSSHLPVKSGKSFSKSWTSKYKKMPKKMTKKMPTNKKQNVDNADKENRYDEDEDEENTSVENVKDPQDEKNVGYIAKTTEAVKDAVHVVESGVTGLLHGASEALKDMSPFSKR